MFKLKEGMKVKIKYSSSIYTVNICYTEKFTCVDEKYVNFSIPYTDIDWEETAKLNGIDLEKQKYIKGLIERGDSEEQIKNKVNEVFGEEKEYNPKYDKDKLDWTLLPINEVEEIVKVLNYGVNKYGVPNAWQGVENAKERYLSATYRHLVEYTKGNKIDSESGLSHLSHLATNIIFLMRFENNKEE